MKWMSSERRIRCWSYKKPVPPRAWGPSVRYDGIFVHYDEIPVHYEGIIGRYDGIIMQYHI